MKNRFVVGFALAALISFFFSGCGGCEPPTSLPDAETPNDIEVCVKDADLIAARSICTANDDCPCGTFCALGECVADCLADVDCDDGSCNLMGHCSTSTDERRTPNLSPSQEGVLVVSASVVQVFDATTARQIRISARNLDLGRVRVLAVKGLEVSCDGQTFSTECLYDNVLMSAASVLLFKPTSALDAGKAREIRNFAGSQR
ncbi:MAG: hypothetical protein GY822_22445 [Deltaproteobacteria bacterium]|nr:hypothetical protein [Deltaproteobacteria bacterium]